MSFETLTQTTTLLRAELSCLVRPESFVVENIAVLLFLVNVFCFSRSHFMHISLKVINRTFLTLCRVKLVVFTLYISWHLMDKIISHCLEIIFSDFFDLFFSSCSDLENLYSTGTLGGQIFSADFIHSSCWTNNPYMYCPATNWEQKLWNKWSVVVQ